MIVLQTKESALFESAYFVLRRGRGAKAQGDMLEESNRIIAQGREYLQKRCGRRRFPLFLCGFLTGAALVAAIVAIILL